MAEVLHELRSLSRAVRLVAKAAGRWTLVWALPLGAQGLLRGAVVFLVRGVVDSLVAALGEARVSFAFRSILRNLRVNPLAVEATL